jgi:hypothetical protein
MHLGKKNLDHIQDGFKNYLGAKKGLCIIPLEYIVWSTDEPGQAGIVYTTVHKNFVVTTPLEGDSIEAANGRVWLALKNWLLKGPVYTYCSHLDGMKNSMAANNALQSQNE